jgi:multidrug transporter EmrE-like cation transporter
MIGVFVFKESLSTIEIIGMIFAIISLFILARFG